MQILHYLIKGEKAKALRDPTSSWTLSHNKRCIVWIMITEIRFKPRWVLLLPSAIWTENNHFLLKHFRVFVFWKVEKTQWPLHSKGAVCQVPRQLTLVTSVCWLTLWAWAATGPAAPLASTGSCFFSFLSPYVCNSVAKDTSFNCMSLMSSKSELVKHMGCSIFLWVPTCLPYFQFVLPLPQFTCSFSSWLLVLLFCRSFIPTTRVRVNCLPLTSSPAPINE